MFRKILFWSHLCCGVAAGVVILMLSVTGVILTYERQMLEWELRVYHAEPEAEQAIRPIEQLVAAVVEQAGFQPSSLTFAADPAAPALAQQGRAEARYLNPYTAEVYPPHESSLDNFFSTVTAIHRWFNVGGDGRDAARQVTGISNLIFLFIIISGLYLWLPKMYRWVAFKMRLWFVKSPNSAARDFNWHHVFGIWAAIPLIVIVCTGAVFNYSWANNLVYTLMGEEPPQRGSRGPVSGGQETPLPTLLPLETIFAQSRNQVDGWNKLTINLPSTAEEKVSVAIDQGNGGQPQKRHTLILDAQSGDMLEWQPFSSLSAGRQARSWVRFLHTGEALGVVGQTVAGLASFAAVMMVWTGLALALRRLQRSRAKARRKSLGPAAQASS